MKKLFLVSMVVLISGALFFAEPPALPNVGETCFMNAALQNFYNMSLLTDAVLFEKINIRDIAQDDARLYQYYATTLDAMHQAQGTGVEPDVLENLAKLGCQRAGQIFGRQQDPTEIVVNPILNILPPELTKLFSSHLVSSIGCPYKAGRGTGLGVVSQTTESLAVLSVGIKGESLYSSLKDGFFKGEALTGDNTYRYRDGNQYSLLEELFNTKEPEDGPGIYIEGCQQWYHMKTFPAYIIIQLKRFLVEELLDEKGMKRYVSKRNDAKVDIPLKLDMSLYAEAIVAQQEYALIGAVLQRGTLTEGHYRAYIKDQFDVNQPWYLCDDDTITQIEDLKDLAEQGYVLFYIRSDKIADVQQQVQERSLKMEQISKEVQNLKKLDVLGQALSSLAHGS